MTFQLEMCKTWVKYVVDWLTVVWPGGLCRPGEKGGKGKEEWEGGISAQQILLHPGFMLSVVDYGQCLHNNLTLIYSVSKENWAKWTVCMCVCVIHSPLLQESWHAPCVPLLPWCVLYWSYKHRCELTLTNTNRPIMCKQLIRSYISTVSMHVLSLLAPFLQYGSGQCVLSVWRGYVLCK